MNEYIPQVLSQMSLTGRLHNQRYIKNKYKLVFRDLYIIDVSSPKYYSNFQNSVP